MSSSTTIVGNSRARPRVCAARASSRLARHRAAASRAGRAGRGRRSCSWWRRRRTGANGSGTSSASFLRELELGGRHRFEVGALQALAVGERERRVEPDLFVRGFVRRAARVARRAAARAPRRGGSARGASALFAAPADLRQQRGHQLLEQLRVAPERVERGVEERLLLVPVEHHRAERGVHVVAPLEADARSPRARRARGPARPACRRRAARARNGRRCRRASARAAGGGDSAARRRLQLGEQLRDVAALQLGDVVAVLEQHAERVVHVAGSRRDRVRARPARWSSRSSRRCRAP